ncbi:MAG: hypothetical protein WC119_00660 [Synergistaceae bacterium]
MEKEHIVQAAIKYKATYYTGWRHCSIGLKMLEDKVCNRPYPGSNAQGFITNTGRFVSRQEAFSIAKDSGQLIPEFLEDTKLLLSEMLWDKNGKPVTCMEDYGKASGLSKS